MDRIEAMRVFVRIVERESFAQAARDLQIPRPTATNAIKQLETALGTRLLERTTRHVRPTLDGEAYYERCVRLLADLDEAESTFRNASPRGPLRVDMQGTLARFFVLPALPRFIARYPGIALRLSEGDRMVDMIQEGVDCVLRAGELKDSSLIGRRVASFEQVTCASPDYLARFGVPQSLDDLAGHQMVAYASSAAGQAYPLEFREQDQLRLVPLPHEVTVSGAEIYTASAVAGLGLIQVPLYRVRHQLEADVLRLVLPHHPPPPMPVSVLYPHNRHLSPRVRVFVDWLGEIFAEAAKP
ncbi:LysR family transcriptional regulator [Sphingomonas oleivorans]|uniref:LysR family transcriptional regulator n=1 Tax=Sphingomonas oleivorans TaxID=1735121 RepID=A0A2T5FTN7_9SPHN|nr:LysR family transcriptional regulator [Sphingomonas oleivorans]PTQ07429.1 LysR family transcriptional regulator [Sphingomonas oleivorans]